VLSTADGELVGRSLCHSYFRGVLVHLIVCHIICGSVSCCAGYMCSRLQPCDRSAQLDISDALQLVHMVHVPLW
jgi:hypothetical protein